MGVVCSYITRFSSVLYFRFIVVLAPSVRWYWLFEVHLLLLIFQKCDSSDHADRWRSGWEQRCPRHDNTLTCLRRCRWLFWQDDRSSHNASDRCNGRRSGWRTRLILMKDVHESLRTWESEFPTTKRNTITPWHEKMRTPHRTTWIKMILHSDVIPMFVVQSLCLEHVNSTTHFWQMFNVKLFLMLKASSSQQLSKQLCFNWHRLLNIRIAPCFWSSYKSGSS